MIALASCSSCSSCSSCKNEKEVQIKSVYEDIILKYKELLEKKKNSGNTLTVSDNASDTDKALYDIVNACEDPSIMGYATKDINGDGFDELVLMSRGNDVDALFTQKDGSPVLLLSQGTIAIYPDGTVYSHVYVKDTSVSVQFKRIVDGKLEGDEYGGYVNNEEKFSYYKIVNGVRSDITYDEYYYATDQSQAPDYITKTTGFRFIPAVADDGGTAPVADLSSYDGIIAAYKTIVGSFSEYTQSKWIDGEFDGMFKFSDNESYDVFHAIFYGGIKVMPSKTYYGSEYAEGGDNAYGYAKKDIDGNGVEELVLMTGNYDIIAVFTLKNGKAVLLDGLCGSMIDENGKFYTSKALGGALSRDGEVFVYEIKGGELKATVALGYKVNVYLQKEGWYKIEKNSKTEISNEEGEALYAQYDIIPVGYSENEYTRTFSGLEFVPLFEAIAANDSYIGTYSQYVFVNGSILTVSAAENGFIDFVFECVHTVGEFDPENSVLPETYETLITATALFSENRYLFEKDGVKGYLQLSVNSVWVVVTESQNEHVPCKAYLFYYLEG